MLKSLRSRRSAVKALAVGAVLGAGLVTSAAPAQAAASNCPQSRVCFYDGAYFTGFRHVEYCYTPHPGGSFKTWRGLVNNRLISRWSYHNRGVTSMHNRCPQNLRIKGRRASRIIKTGQRIGELGYSHLSNDPDFQLG